MDPLLQDLRFALRGLLRRPGASAVAVVTLAVGLGATTVVFGLANALLFRPLPVHDPATLIDFAEIHEGLSPVSNLSYRHLQDYREGSRDVARVAGWGMSTLAFNPGDDPTTLLGGFVTADFFEVLGVQPGLGRFFAPDEETPGDPREVAVLAHDLWQRSFGADPDVLGRTIRVNGRQLSVIGVAPAGFHGLMIGIPVDVWIPIPAFALLDPGASDIYHPTSYLWLQPVARLAPGATRAQAEAVIGTVGRGIEPRWNDQPIQGVQVSALSTIPLEGRTPLNLFMVLLFGTAGLVLLIACVNVAGMLLAQATVRRREVGIRRALGAGRGRLVRQFLTETLVLFALGAAGAFLLASWVAGLLVAFLPSLPVPVHLDLSIDGRVAVFALALALVTGVAAGLAPALEAAGPDLVDSLKRGEGGAGGRSRRLRSAFVAGQISLTVLLLVTAGLFARSLQEALAVDPGFDPEGVVVAGIDLQPHGYDAERSRILLGQLRERLQADPDVREVGLSQIVPLGFDQLVYGVEIPGVEPPEGRSTIPIDFNVVDDGFFDAVRIPIVSGRYFSSADHAEAPGVAVVNETMARRFWPDGDAVGTTIRVGGVEREVVGVARDSRYRSLREDPLPFLYLPHSQASAGGVTLYVRSPADPGAVAAIMRRELRSLDGDVPLVNPTRLSDRVTAVLLPQRVGATLIGTFGALGLLLAAVGLYGTLAYGVSRRIREIGVRLALGASTGAVRAMVIRQGLLVVGAGLAVGLAIAAATTRALSGLLIEVSPTDPVTFLGAGALLLAVAFLACWLPARRATRVDPMVALRAD